eukprot:GFUD01118808.1.p1 GENE.GFUD01118808.1~~GFUD01118808.1.p1  ORF type:complete len:163 (+),score=42.33 GFUD01118808.1:122-610(+)
MTESNNHSSMPWTSTPSSYSLMCQTEETNESPLPDFCHQIFDNYTTPTLEEHVKNTSATNSSSALYSEIIEPNPFVKVLSMMGIFGGVVMSLALLMYFTFVRPRKTVEESEEDLANSPVLTLAQYNVQMMQPPDYATVVSKEEEELPSYSEAVNGCGGEIYC